MSKVKFEVDVDESVLADIDSICDRFGFDYEESVEFMVVFAKTGIDKDSGDRWNYSAK